MSKVDTTSLRQLYAHLGLEPEYVMSSLVSYQLQQQNPQEKLPERVVTSINRLRDLAVMSKDYLQIGALDYAVGLDFLQGGRGTEAVSYFEAARLQWLFIDHLPLISLAHFGTAMAFHSAGDFRQAAAAYFKVKQCLQQAETEPHRLEEIEVERSLQPFWNDLERKLELDVRTLRRDFSRAQDDALRAELKDISGEPDVKPHGRQGLQEGAVTLTLQMQTASSMTSKDVDTLILKTVDSIEILDKALAPPGKDQVRARPTVSRLTYGPEGPITIELANVNGHAVALCRWLMTIVTAEEHSPGGVAPEVGESPIWFSWQAQPSYIGEFVKTVVQSATGESPDDSVVELLLRAVSHLAELHLNCNLTVK